VVCGLNTAKTGQFRTGHTKKRNKIRVNSTPGAPFSEMKCVSNFVNGYVQTCNCHWSFALVARDNARPKSLLHNDFIYYKRVWRPAEAGNRAVITHYYRYCCNMLPTPYWIPFYMFGEMEIAKNLNYKSKNKYGYLTL